MNRLKTLIQIVVIYLPILYWNTSFDSMEAREAMSYILLGGVIAGAIELLWMYLKYLVRK